MYKFLWALDNIPYTYMYVCRQYVYIQYACIQYICLYTTYMYVCDTCVYCVYTIYTCKCFCSVIHNKRDLDKQRSKFTEHWRLRN